MLLVGAAWGGAPRWLQWLVLVAELGALWHVGRRLASALLKGAGRLSQATAALACAVAVGTSAATLFGHVGPAPRGGLPPGGGARLGRRGRRLPATGVVAARARDRCAPVGPAGIVRSGCSASPHFLLMGFATSMTGFRSWPVLPAAAATTSTTTSAPSPCGTASAT